LLGAEPEQPAPALSAEEQRLAQQAAELNAEGGRLYGEGKYAEAAEAFRRALEYVRRLCPKDRHPDGHPDLATSINNLAVLYESMGEYAKAEPLFQEALAMRRALFPKDRFPDGHPDLAISLNNLGGLYQRAGKYTKAKPLYRQALEMKRALYPKGRYPDGHPELATGMNNLGFLYASAGEYAKAEPLFQEALAMRRALFPKERFPDGHPLLAASLNNLGALYVSAGQYARAEPLLRQALQMRRALFPKDRFPDGHSDLARGIGNLGSLYRSAGEYAKAEPLLREALDMDRALFPKERFPSGHPLLAASINNLGFVYHSAGEYAKAERLHREALDMCRALFPKPRFPNGHPDLARGILNLGAVYRSAGKNAKAEPLFREALQMYSSLAEVFLAVAAEAQAMNFLAAQPHAADALLSATRQLPASPDRYDALYDGRAPLWRLLQRRRLDLAAAHDPRAHDLQARLADVRRQLSNALLAPRGAVAADAGRLTADKEALEKELAVLLRLPGPTQPAPARAAVLAAALPAGCAFVDVRRHTDFEQDPDKPGRAGLKVTPRYVAFALKKGQAVVRVELGEARAIERAWAEWHKAITAGAPDRRQAEALAQLVWQPLREHLPEGTKAVWLCPSAALCQVPWAALPGRKPGSVLLEDHALAVVPHGPFLADALRGAAPAAAAKDTVLLVGGVDYDGAPVAPAETAVAGLRDPAGVGRKGLKYLPGTLAELQRIRAEARAALKAEPVALQGKEAGVAALLGQLPKARYAHVATHGFFADAKIRSVLHVDEQHFLRAGLERAAAGARNPLVLSGLILAGANRSDAGPDRGILTAEGIVGLNLEGMELAVLSACETGLGEVAGGEGVLGLVRAFHVAGARNVVASLWRVDDDATAALMSRFYHRLWADKVPPLEALRQAQLEVYRQPGRIGEWAGREIDTTEAPLPKGPARAARPAEHARTAQWAAFLLSGAGR
jgi:CHAT domain-containing protein/Tfp pilus assembly protein PilF